MPQEKADISHCVFFPKKRKAVKDGFARSNIKHLGSCSHLAILILFYACYVVYGQYCCCGARVFRAMSL